MTNMWNSNQSYHTVQDIDRWSSPPPDTLWAKWFGGIIFPSLILWLACYTTITKRGFLLGQHNSRLDLHGTDAVLLGCTLTCLAFFLHTHYFWGNSQKLMPFHEAGKTLTPLGFCFFLVWLVIRIFADAFG